MTAGVEVYEVHLEGELDLANADELLHQWLAAVDRNAPERFVIDLTAVTFMDSTGLAAIVGLDHYLRGRGGRVVVANPSGQISLLLQITGMDRIVDVTGGRSST